MDAKTTLCPCCQQPVTLDPMAEARAALAPLQRAVLDAVLRRPGLSRDEIMDRVYSEDPNGGPDCGSSVIGAHLYQANKRLQRFGFRITCGSGRRTGYRLERLA